VGTCTALMTNE